MSLSFKVLIITVILLISHVESFHLSPIGSRGFKQSKNTINKSTGVTSSTKLNMDATLIPMLVGATGLIFAVLSFDNKIDSAGAVFSFDNKIDLTDAGMAKAKAIRYNERKEKGEIPSKEALANADPYRWFADEDEEVDILTVKKKKGGGCG